MSSPSAVVAGHRSVHTSLLIGVLCLVVYSANLRSISAGDAYPARYLPFGILRYGSLSLDPILSLVRQGRGAGAYWVVSGRGGRAISLYPIVLPVLISPLYLPAAVYLHRHGWPERSTERAARIMEKATASLLAASATALLYRLLRRRASSRVAFLLAVVFAFGTTTWVISSQALWQHGLAELLIVGALLLVTGPATPTTVLAAGIVLGLIAANRPPDALLAAGLGLHGLWWARRRAPLLVAAAAVPAGMVFFYNMALAGHWAGGYGVFGQSRPQFLQGDILAGMSGLLFSPTHGLFVFSPFLLFIPLAFRPAWEAAGQRRLTLILCISMALQLLLYSKAKWIGGESWGPRWLTDMLPILFWMLPPIVVALRGAARLAFIAACGAAIVIEAIGAFWYIHASDAAIFGAPSPVRAAWSLSNAPFILELRHPPAAAELWTPQHRCDSADVAGNLDRLLVGTREAQEIEPGDELRAEGWTLVGGRTPWEVAVVVDGQPAGSTSTFLVRQDVVRALGSASPSGWYMLIRTAGLSAGEHSLDVVAHGCETVEPLTVVRRRILVSGAPTGAPTGAATGAATGARRAAAILQQHQQPAGFWLTSYTSAPRFEDPREEMNTFLTATLVDILGPVAAEAGLDETLARARRHLAAQIEGGGLVRYHGLPDGPTIGRLGCVISPDADDTALVWRIAPADKPGLRRAAIATLEQYRTADGLYRTWLAPRDRYQCIDPGRDPNPTDVGIQMHVLMFLAGAEPPAARALCNALARVIDEDRAWVYYGLTPLVPILRQADLAKTGCPLSLPSKRLRAAIAGQEGWVSASRLLQRLAGQGGTAPGSDEILALLSRLSADDFAAIRHNPPLVYHNDLTASVPRFYWSQDVGYALWLRLLFEQARRHPLATGGGGR
jgi:hypothetical protein